MDKKLEAKWQLSRVAVRVSAWVLPNALLWKAHQVFIIGRRQSELDKAVAAIGPAFAAIA